MTTDKEVRFGLEHWPKWKQLTVFFFAVIALLWASELISHVIQNYFGSPQAKVVQPSFRDRYDAIAKITAPALGTRECTTTRSVGRNRDTLIKCPLASPGAQLTVSGLNNLFTGALLDLDVQKLSNSSDLMKAGRILLRLARGKDAENEDPSEMTQLVIEAQQHLGEGACIDTPEQRTRFCVMTDDKAVYHFAVVDPEMWK